MTSEEKKFSRKDIFEHVRNLHPKVPVNSPQFTDSVRTSLLDLFGVQKNDVEKWDKFDSFVNYFRNRVKTFWNKNKCVKEACYIQHKKFFDVKVKRSDLFYATPPQIVMIQTETDPPLQPQPKPLDHNYVNPDLKEPPKKRKFSDKSRSQQDKITRQIREDFDEDSIIKSAIQVFKDRGQNDISFIINTLSKNPEKAKPVRKFLSSDINAEVQRKQPDRPKNKKKTARINAKNSPLTHELNLNNTEKTFANAITEGVAPDGFDSKKVEFSTRNAFYARKICPEEPEVNVFKTEIGIKEEEQEEDYNDKSLNLDFDVDLL